MELKVSTNAIEIARILGKDVTEQIPFATAMTLNRVADRIRAGERKVIQRVLDRPTPFTLNSFQVTPARKNRLRSEAGWRDKAVKGGDPNIYLAPHVFGGPRRHTRFESLLAQRRMIPTGSFLVPAAGAPRDGYGNVSRGLRTRILSALGAHSETGFQANRTGSKRSQRKAKAFDVFVGRPEGEDTLAIWQRINTSWGKGLKPLFWVQQRAPRYRKRFAFFEVAQNVHKAHYEREFRIAIVEALKTAR